MADLTADASLRILGDSYTEKFLIDTSLAQTIFKGCAVMIDQNVDTTHVRTEAGMTSVDGDVCVGVAAEKVTVALNDAETSYVECYVGPTIVGFKSAVFTEADLGKTVYTSETGVLTATNGAYPSIGKLFRVRDGYAFVLLTTPQIADVP
jgi:hypothetical protein